MKLSEIAKLFGIGSGSRVTKTISRLIWRLEDDQVLLGIHNVHCRDLTPPLGFYFVTGFFRSTTSTI